MTTDFSSVQQNQPIRDVAYEQLKHGIITGEIPAGTRIVETAYSEHLHISRTPLREALHRLERDGLVQYTPHRGVIVNAFTISDIEEIFIIRNAMMMLLLPSIVKNVQQKDFNELNLLLREMDASLAVEDVEALAVLNRKFHRYIERLSDKHRILYVIDSQEEYIMRFSAMAIASVVRRTHAHEEHHQMVSYLKERDLDSLRELMAHHLEESKNTCLEAIKHKKQKAD